MNIKDNLLQNFDADQAEDILAERLAEIFVMQILEEEKNEHETKRKN